MKHDDLPTKRFRSQAVFAAWLDKNHATAAGVWIQFAKKGTGIATVVYAEALDVALCYGWIDGQVRSLDETYFLHRFTPRRARSNWSKINCTKADALIAAGRMKATGLKAVEAARSDGRWDAAYAGQRTIEVAADLAAALKKHPKAKKNFEALSSQNRYAILYRLQEAKKAETRARRIQKYIDMLLRGETFH